MSAEQTDPHIAELNDCIDTHGLPIVVEVRIGNREYLMLDFPRLRETWFINSARKLIETVQHNDLSQFSLQVCSMVVGMVEQSVQYFIEIVWPGMDVTREPVPASPLLLVSLLELMFQKCSFNSTLLFKIYNCYDVLRARQVLGVLRALTLAIEGGRFDSVRDVTNIPLSMVTDQSSTSQTAAKMQLSASVSLSSTVNTSSSGEEFFTPPQTPAQPGHISTLQTSGDTSFAGQPTLPIVRFHYSEPHVVVPDPLSRERMLSVEEFQNPSTPSPSRTDTLPAENFTGPPVHTSNRDVLPASAPVDSLSANLLSSTNATGLLDTPSPLSTSATFPANLRLHMSETTSTSSSIGMARSTSLDSIPRSVGPSTSEVWAHVQSQITLERIATLQSMVADGHLLGLNISIAPHGSFVAGSSINTLTASPAPSHVNEDGVATASLLESPVNGFGPTTTPQSPPPKPVRGRAEWSTGRRRGAPLGPRSSAKDVITNKPSRSSPLPIVHPPNVDVEDPEDANNKENNPLYIGLN